MTIEVCPCDHVPIPCHPAPSPGPPPPRVPRGHLPPLLEAEIAQYTDFYNHQVVDAPPAVRPPRLPSSL